MKPTLYQGDLFVKPPRHVIDAEPHSRGMRWASAFALAAAVAIIANPCDVAADSGPGWHPPADVLDHPPGSVGPCSLVEYVCTYDAETGTQEVAYARYLCELGPLSWEVVVEGGEGCHG